MSNFETIVIVLLLVLFAVNLLDLLIGGRGNK